MINLLLELIFNFISFSLEGKFEVIFYAKLLYKGKKFDKAQLTEKAKHPPMSMFTSTIDYLLHQRNPVEHNLLVP